MNNHIISLIEKFWYKNEVEYFTPIEIALFHYLVMNVPKGKTKHSNAKICAALSTTEKTLIKARKTLISHKVITFKAGDKREISEYQMGSFE